MEVYIEYVIIDNFVITYMLAALTYRILLKRISVRRALSASAVGTGVTVAYPFVKGNLWLILLKVALWVILSLILFLKKDKFFLCSAVFLGLTFVFGGALFAAGYIISGNAEAAMRTNMFDFPVSLIIICVFIIYFVVKKLAIKLHRLKDLSEVIYDFSLSLLGRSMKFRGLMDTGNRLYDSYSGLPVIVLGAKSLMGVLSDEQFRILFSGHGENLQQGARYMEISTVAGGKNKILLLKPESFVLYSARGENILYDVMVGVSFSPMRDSTDYDAILHPALV